MKLNDKGFGTKDMIIYTCLFIFLLLLVNFAVINLSNSIEKKSSKERANALVVEKQEPKKQEENTKIYREESLSVYYNNKEKELENAALKYAEKNKLNAYNGFVVGVDTLISNKYMEKIVDYEGLNYCGGYAKIINNGERYDVDAYIKCSDYETEGF